MSLFCLNSKYLKMISRHCLLAVTFLAIPLAAEEPSLHDQLKNYAEQFVYSQMVIDPTTQVEVEAEKIDNRRQLHDCSGHITASVANDEIKRRTTVKLSCDQQPTWETYVPVRIRVLKPVVTVSTPVSKEIALTADMLKVDFVEEQFIRGDVFTEIAPLIGVRSRRELRPGQPVRQSQICVVCKGDTVQIEAATSAFAIRTAGQAQQDGSFGDTIRVENLRSHRIVSATVIAIGQVRVKL